MTASGQRCSGLDSGVGVRHTQGGVLWCAASPAAHTSRHALKPTSHASGSVWPAARSMVDDRSQRNPTSGRNSPCRHGGSASALRSSRHCPSTCSPQRTPPHRMSAMDFAQLCDLPRSGRYMRTDGMWEYRHYINTQHTCALSPPWPYLSARHQELTVKLLHLRQRRHHPLHGATVVLGHHQPLGRVHACGGGVIVSVSAVSSASAALFRAPSVLCGETVEQGSAAGSRTATKAVCEGLLRLQVGRCGLVGKHTARAEEGENPWMDGAHPRRT